VPSLLNYKQAATTAGTLQSPTSKVALQEARSGSCESQHGQLVS
jgi:hypothetical protein